MKKNVISLILSLVVCAVCLTGCVNINISDDGVNITSTEKEEEVTSEEEETPVFLANPWEETTPKDLADYHGIFFLLPDEAEDVYYQWSESLNMAEADFSLNSLEYCYRIGYTKMLQDISGLNYEWDVDETIKINECHGRHMKLTGDGESVEAYLWYDEVWSRTNCLSVVADDLEGVDVRALVDKVYNQTSEEDCMMECLNAPYWVANYDARYLTSYEAEGGEIVFSYTSPIYNAAGSNVVSVSIRENTTCEEVLSECKEKNDEPDAENVFGYFGADGIDSYSFIPKGNDTESESELKVSCSYTAIPFGDDVILIDAFYTLEPDENSGAIIASAFETLLDSFKVLEQDDTKAEEKTVKTSDEALELLTEGNKKYLAGEPVESVSQELRENLAENGQHPYAVVVTCSDSRVPAELIFNCSAGDIFVIRTAGNVVSDFELGSIEYGVEHCNAPLVVVLGHSNCGAVTAACEDEKSHDKGHEKSHNKEHDYISSLVTEIVPSVEKARKETESDEELLSKSIELNVINTMDKIHTSDIISEMEENDLVKVVGAVYDIETGEIEWK